MPVNRTSSKHYSFPLLKMAVTVERMAVSRKMRMRSWQDNTNMNRMETYTMWPEGLKALKAQKEALTNEVSHQLEHCCSSSDQD